MRKVILTTGGTGGHIYPALAVADKLKLKGVETIFVGSTERMEKDLVPDSGHRFIGIDISVPKGLKNIRKYLKAIRVAYKVIKEEKPDAIIGFGNYISVPVIIAGILLRKKIYLQEQNVNIGSANKMFYKIAKMTFLAFDKTYDDIPINLCPLSGTKSFSIRSVLPTNTGSIPLIFNLSATASAGYICPPVPPVVSITFFIFCTYPKIFKTNSLKTFPLCSKELNWS